MPSLEDLRRVEMSDEPLFKFEGKNLVRAKAQEMADKKHLNYFIYIYKKKAVSEDDLEDKICFEFSSLFPIESPPKKKSWAVSAKELKDIKDNIEKNLLEIYNKIEIARASKYGWDRLNEDDVKIKALKYDLLPFKQKIKSKGIDLMRLIASEFPGEITTNLEKPNKYMWLFCEVKEVSCLWEWIYLEPSEKFLGDEFLLVRLPGHAKFKYYQTNFEIENPVAWSDKSECSNSQTVDLEKKLKELHCVLHKESIKKYSLVELIKKYSLVSRSKKKTVADFIHIAAKEAKIDQIVKGDDINFVFSNICECSHPLYFKVQESAIPTHVIETSFKIPEEFSLRFALDFYYAFLTNNETMADAFNKAREKTLKSNDLMKVWRLAYVMCGNPFGKVSH